MKKENPTQYIHSLSDVELFVALFSELSIEEIEQSIRKFISSISHNNAQAHRAATATLDRLEAITKRLILINER